MTILSRVSAAFRDPKTGQTIYTITGDDLLAIREAPEAIRQDPLFQLLLEDGSIDIVTRESQKKALESEPTAGTDASGKKLTKSTTKKTAKAEEAPAEQADQSASAEKPE